jgi:hypothetical protein
MSFSNAGMPPILHYRDATGGISDGQAAFEHLFSRFERRSDSKFCRLKSVLSTLSFNVRS